MEVKFIILALLLMLFLSAWIFSKSNFATKLKMTDPLFNAANLILFFCSLGGFILTLIIGDAILSSHAFEIILIPALIAFIITGLAAKNENAEDKFDEKQKSDMKDAAVFSWMSVIITIFILYAMYSAGNITGLIFFPVIIFIAFISYSGSLIFFYKFG